MSSKESDRVASYTFEAMAAPHGSGVIDIFNAYVQGSFAAYPDEPLPYAAYDRFLAMAQGYPSLVALDGNSEVAGFAFLHPFRPGAAFRRTAEVTYFIRAEDTHRGLGTHMLAQLVDRAREQGIEILLANVSSRNEASLAFHRKHGFVECGRFRRVGRKFGEDFDMVWVQRDL